MSETGLKAKVFISCGQRNDEERMIAHKIADRLGDLGFEPYVAVQETTLVGLKENIFRQLATSEYFVFVDLRRERLGGKRPPVYRGSLFAHQELALASYLEIESAVFQEEGVKPDDGIMFYIQANATPFGDRHSLHRVVADTIIERGWESNWKRGLRVLDQVHVLPNVVDQDDRHLRYLLLAVENTDMVRAALVCYVQLRGIRSVPDGKPLRYPPVELTWAGCQYPSAPIPPASTRLFDAVVVPHDNPRLAVFQVLTTSSAFARSAHGPGAFELSYAVMSDAFPEVKATFRLELGTALDDVKLERVHE